jgi:hypothetical protein
MTKMITTLAAIATLGSAVAAAPAIAHERYGHGYGYGQQPAYGYDARYGNGYGYDARYDRGPREWRGSDGRTYCRKKDGTVGLIVGGAAGALIGRGLDGGYNRSTGTILGAAAGALIGKELASKRRCR